MLFVLRRAFFKAMDEQTELWEICRQGNLEELRNALQAGADPNSRRLDDTCLMVAVRAHREEVVDLLLAQPGIEVNAKDGTNRTAMHWACSSGTVGIMSKLLAVPGVLMNNKTKSGRTPVAEAKMSRNPDTLQLMTTVEEVDLDVRDFSGMSLEDMAYR